MSWSQRQEYPEYRWWTLTNPHNFHMYIKDDESDWNWLPDYYITRFDRLYIREKWVGFKGKIEYGPEHKLNVAPDGPDGKYLIQYKYAPRRVDVHMAGVPPIGHWIPTENY